LNNNIISISGLLKSMQSLSKHITKEHKLDLIILKVRTFCIKHLLVAHILMISLSMNMSFAIIKEYRLNFLASVLFSLVD